MSDFSVKILGCGSATPSLRHNPSCQIISHGNRQFMVDCGEGAQLQMRRYRVKFSTLRHIFVTHLHGDHMLGLPGLLSTLSLHDIGGQVHVYMFPEGIEWLQQFMRMASHHATVEVVYHPIARANATVYEDDRLCVETLALYHSVPCVGYIFREKPKPRKIRGDMVEFYDVPYYRRPEIKQGADYVTPGGIFIPNDRLTLDPDPALSYAYCADTQFSRKVIEAVTGVTTLYHESTYTHDMVGKARDRGHSTARQAATVAREAGARQLIIGHYSKSYLDEAPLLAEARAVFPDTIAATEGLVVDIK